MLSIVAAWLHPPDAAREAATMHRPRTKALDVPPERRSVGRSPGVRSAEQADAPPPGLRSAVWVLALPDQLTNEVGPLASDPQAGVLLVESDEWMSRRPNHRQRLALLLLNAREFADECRAAGRAVHCERGAAPMVELVRSAHRSLAPAGPIVCMQPAEREMRAELEPLVAEGLLRFVPHEGWMTSPDDLGPMPKGGWRMDAFYRRVRKRLGIMVDASGRPEGGAWSFDAENRERWDGVPAAPEPPVFAMTPRRAEVQRELNERFAHHPGTVDVCALPATLEDTHALWAWALRDCLPHFGPFEDAMSTRSRGLFHSRISPVLNLLRILPARLVKDVLALDIPLACREGFVRQVIGWREFVHHIHDATDGFRSGVGRSTGPVAARPGDGGFARWSGRAWSPSVRAPDEVDGGARPSWAAKDGGGTTPIPPAFWGAPSGLRCLDQVVEGVWAESWSHHITRLMVLGNLATLLEVDPRELADWFWVAYMDAWDWVVEPNVLGMATYSAGDVMTTKPYVCGSAYIRKMGDFCDGCRFQPGTTCPITPMYWAFLSRHEASLRENPRMSLVMGSVRKRSADQRRGDERVASIVRELLVHGKPITVEALR
jgi:deoxyribodipyrimidine photolyase-related protein